MCLHVAVSERTFDSLQDSEDEDEYYDLKKRPLDEDYAESQF